MNCQTFYYSLYTLLTYPETKPNVYIRELFETSKCDDVFDLRDFRSVVERNITSATLTKIKNYDALGVEETKRVASVFNCKSWHKEHIWPALTFSNKLYYTGVEVPREILGKMGIVTLQFGALRNSMKQKS